MTAVKPESAALFERYLEIVNQALARQEGRSPWSGLIPRLRAAIGGKDILVALVDSQRGRPLAWFAVRPVEGRLRRVDGGSVSPNEEGVWTLTMARIAEVVRDPDEAMAAPSCLGLDWLLQRGALAGA